MKDILPYLYPAYLGFALSAIAELQFNDWQIWAILLPTIILVEIGRNESD